MGNARYRLLAVAVVVALLGGALAVYGATSTAYYVSPSGDDANSGSIDSPWRTLAYAVPRLAPGDTLYLREGTYFEHELSITLKGTAQAPIVIRAYPGEIARIDGGLPDFRAAPNDEWELVDAATQLYRSRRTFEGDAVGAWLIDDDIQLVQYEDSANLAATNTGTVNGKAPFYMGPGVMRGDDGRIYIRLQPNPGDLAGPQGQPLTPKPADANPNHNRIAVFSAEHIFALDGAEYVTFKDLSFAYARRILDARNASQHIALDACILRYGSYGLVIRDGVQSWDIRGSEFVNGLPGYVYWTDVKNGDREVAEAYPEFQSAAIIGALPGFSIRDSVFHDTFDALDIKYNSSGAIVERNVFRNIRDDAIELDTGIDNVEVSRNIFWRVGSGISVNSSDATGGSAYIHHNVIDNSALQRGGRPGNYRAEDWPPWTVIDPFSSHGSGDKVAGWKIYNNTIVTRRGGYQWNGSGPDTVLGNSEKYLYNNIFFVLDDRVVFRDDQIAGGAHYDGNILFRRRPGRYPLLLNFGDGGDYRTLAEFQARAGGVWERHGLEIDPGLPIGDIPAPTFDMLRMWELYRPSNPLVFTAGAPYDGLGWPGTEGVTYRGAVSPADPYPAPEPYTPPTP